ncbi:LAMI_0G01618g1_1 [Lachancea mirantina]|uniref:LAMI_0G01618g1_1 n=1 Tax=Lachancea mirantina TaxID=1230905 RepID=A0A1G4K7H6_9SACH|nr:LAMI_0G01618g1_1 [Lachancea mirantina]
MSNRRQSRRDDITRSESRETQARSSSPSLFFKSGSSTSLLRLRQARSPSKDRRSPSASRPNLDSLSSSNELKACDKSKDGDKPKENIMIDVLPSFEMYNALHRHIPQGNINPDLHDYPPTYQEIQDQAASLPLDGRNGSTTEQLAEGGSTSIHRSGSADAFMNTHQRVSFPGLETFSTVQEPIQDDVHDSDNINIDKLYTLPKLTTPIDISIRITKHAVDPNQKPEEESILREYTSGDIINGYIIITNRSSRPLKFEMFYVTLEGYASVVDRDCGKRTVKRFLRMVDLSASWSYSTIEVANGVDYKCGQLDYENCVIGLNNNRILEPDVKYKKYFLFKLPSQLLDISCKHEQFTHCLVPPSYGIDRTRFGGKYSGIKVNSMLGYGHFGTKGSPILTNDLSGEEISINYTLDAKIVGKDPKTRSLHIMREAEYNLRFIPFGFCRPLSGESKASKQVKDFTNLIQDRINALEKVFGRLERNENITSSDIHNSDLRGSIDDETEVDAADILRLKLNQLYVSNREDSAHSSFPIRNGKMGDRKQASIETQFNYNFRTKSKSSSKLKKGIFSGLGASQPASNVGVSQTKSGVIVLSTEIPKAGLPYIKPSLLKKSNTLDARSQHNQENWLSLRDSLSPDDLQLLTELRIQLKCLQANNLEPHDPPEVVGVTTELLCLTARSINSIPIKLSPDILLVPEKLNEVKSIFRKFKTEIIALQAKFYENSTRLNELFNASRVFPTQHELKFSDFISQQMLTDIESLSFLNSNVQVLHNVFKKQSQALAAEEDSIQTASSKNGSGGGILTSTLSGSSSSLSSHTSSSERVKRQLLHEWIKGENGGFQRSITVKLALVEDMHETLIPSFESCLISRMYCIRVNIKFEGQVGTAHLDVPVRIRNLEA